MSVPNANESQLDCLNEAAVQLDCDKDGIAFDEKLRNIAKQEPKEPQPRDYQA